MSTPPYGGTVPPTLAPPVSIVRNTVVPPATTPTTERVTSLAFTGTDLAWVVLVALIVIAAGIALTAAAKKRTRRL